MQVITATLEISLDNQAFTFTRLEQQIMAKTDIFGTLVSNLELAKPSWFNRDKVQLYLRAQNFDFQKWFAWQIDTNEKRFWYICLPVPNKLSDVIITFPASKII